MLSTVTLIPATPEEVAERLDTKMGMVRQALISKGEFLSDPAICGRVHWAASGAGHKLFIKTEDSSTVDAANPLASSDNKTLLPCPQDDLGTTEVDAPSDLPTPPPTPSPAPLAPAVLAMVVKIVPGQNWLYPDGRWTGPIGFARYFSDVKLMCTGSAPSHTRFHNDYNTSVANLDSIMDDMRTAGRPTTGVVLVPDQHVRVRHSLFTEYENADDANPADVAATREWPTTTPEATAALALLAETHAVCPLPAYDQNGCLIEPRLYARRLEGATVIMRFEISHFSIRNRRDKNEPTTDTFSAHIVQLRVIIPPPGNPVTPRRRKLLPSDNYFGAFTPRKGFKDDESNSDKENRGSPIKKPRFTMD